MTDQAVAPELAGGLLSHVLGASATLAWLAAAVYGTAVLDRLIAPASAGMRGRWAVLQPAASALRLLRSGEFTPRRPDGALFWSAPVVAVTAVALIAWLLPLGLGRAGGDAPIGLFLFVVFLGPVVVALANAGWGVNGKYGLYGSMRAISHMVAYEVALGFAVLGPAMAAESLSLSRIIEAQNALWFVVWQPLGLALYLVSALMATYRRPFDTPLAGSELAGGVESGYSGPSLLLLRGALTGLLFVIAAVGAAIYLGGWHGPPVVGPLLPGPAWMLLKTYALVALLLWVGRRTPRLGHNQMLAFSWKVVLPLAFVNVAAVGIIMLVIGL